MLLKRILTLLLISVVVFGCRKDIDNDITITETIIFPKEDVIASMFAQIRNQDGDPVEDVFVSLGTESRTSDEDGMVYFKDVSMNAKGTVVKFEKEGFFDISKIFNPQADKTSYINVKLMPRMSLGSFSATDGGTVSTVAGAKIILPANGFVDDAGNVYNGEVTVYGTYLNPLAEDIFYTMPGDLRAVDAEGAFKQLATYGMIGAELEGASGEKLQIGEGYVATISLPIPQALENSAPASIPLWHFDENSGYWLEEGSAQLESGRYVGEVSHFSFWNCDYPYDLVYMEGSVIVLDGTPVSGALVTIQIVPSGFTGYGVTNSEGIFEGFIPANEELILTVYSPYCNIELNTLNIGPFSEDVILEPIATAVGQEGLFQLTASWVDCDGQPVTDGFAKVTVDGINNFLPISEQGTIFANLPYCGGETGTIIGYDVANEKESDLIEFNIEPFTDLGTVVICEELSEYIIFEAGGYQFTILDPAIYSIGDRMYLTGGGEGDGFAYSMDMTFPNSSPGTFPVDSLNIFISEGGVGTYYFGCGSFSECIDVNHSGVVPVGETVTGSFQGETNGGTVTVNGNFKAIME
ncbi:MAG: carboxypeptidase regulatory-like domain-containing protein [Bacteroidetes bacterium]|nr:MAG: carboxypeptidase regulatory-like domain-containing protein [Bacteroidota bacterium]